MLTYLIYQCLVSAEIMNTAALDAMKHLPSPKNVFQALSAPDWWHWVLAMRSEHASWLKLRVFTLIDKWATTMCS